MNTDYRISNFRAIDKDGTYVDLRPITILTGCNNSGKSSVVKSLCLLNDFFRQIEADLRNDKPLRLHEYKLDFHKRPHDVLGDFYQVVHKGDTTKSTKRNNTFTVEISSYSHFFMQYVNVQLTFCALAEDDLNNGYLQSISIHDLKGDALYTSTRDGEMGFDFTPVKKELLHFIYTQHFLHKWQYEYGYSAIMGYDGDGSVAADFENAFKSIVHAFNGSGVIELFEWYTTEKSENSLYKNNTSKDVLLGSKLINKSFIESPELCVFSFFPFMSEIKGVKKQDVIRKIENAIDSSKNLTKYDKKLIATFLCNFKVSEYDSIMEMIGSMENGACFSSKTSKSLGLNDEVFQMPRIFFRGLSTIHEETKIPQKLSYDYAIYAMDKINQIMTDSTTSYLDYNEIEECDVYFLNSRINFILTGTIEDILLQSLPGDILYTRTSLVNVKRLYGLEEDNDFSDMLKTFFENKRKLSEIQQKNSDKEDDYVACSFLNKWLNKLEIAHHADIKLHADGYGVTIRLYSSEKEKKGMLLADKGYGCTQIFSILLKIESAILASIRLQRVKCYNGWSFSPYNTAGVPEKIVALMRPYHQLHPITIALEEPENHLHPSIQSKLADMMIDAYENYGIHFMVESHSEYLIRKLQLSVAQKEVKNESISLLYVNSATRPSYMPMISDIGIDKNGNLKNEFGSGFFDEALRLSRELFKSTIDTDEE